MNSSDVPTKKKREIPNFGSPLIETHCHLDYLKDWQLDQLFSKCQELNIKNIITIAVSPENFKSVLDISRLHPMLSCTLGVHPHQAKQWCKDVENSIRNHLKEEHHRIVAIGEIGLDYYYLHSEKRQQLKAFEQQLELAIESQLPVVIHSRDAEEDTISVLNNFKEKLKRKAVIHSFTSKEVLAEFALKNDFFLGFNGIITFKNAEEVRNSVRLAALEQILIETDAPFLAPVPYRGRENAPLYLPFIAEKIAEIKNIEVVEVCQKTTQNAQEFFSLHK